MAKSFLALIVLALFSGCHPLGCKEILGERWETKKTRALQGWWKNESGDLCRLSLKKDGSLIMAWLDREEDAKGFVCVNVECTFTHIGERDFVFAKGINLPDAEEGYGFALVCDCSDDKITIAYPNETTFMDLVESKKLMGTIEKDADKTVTDQVERKSPAKPEEFVIKDEGTRTLITANAEDFIREVEAAGINKCFGTDKISLVVFERVLKARN